MFTGFSKKEVLQIVITSTYMFVLGYLITAGVLLVF